MNYQVMINVKTVNSMIMNNVLVTGANRGLGFEIARQIGKKGFHVFFSGRNQMSLEEGVTEALKESLSAEMLLMDVSSDDSVRAAARQLADKMVRLDVIVNNAGILERGDDSLIDDNIDILMNTVNTNSYGTLRVVREFLPLMNTPGRIVNVSSGGGSMSDPVGGWSPAYCVSKTMLNALTRHLAYELRSLKISVNAVCPGWVRTEMGGRSAPRPVEKGAETPVWLATEASQNLTGKFFRDKKEIPW